MQEKTKNKIILVLGLLAIFFFISLISAYQDAAKQKVLLNKERRLRIGIEERVLNLSNQNANLKGEISQLHEALDKEKAAQEALTQEIEESKEELESN